VPVSIDPHVVLTRRGAILFGPKRWWWAFGRDDVVLDHVGGRGDTPDDAHRQEQDSERQRQTHGILLARYGASGPKYSLGLVADKGLALTASMPSGRVMTCG